MAHRFAGSSILETHRNNIGLLRLVFASLVIIGHAPEIIDGNRSRDLLTSVFHTVATGELAVDAFFLISGYLIAKSMIVSASVPYYLERRVFRIYPGYIIAYLLSVFALGSLVGARAWTELPLTFARLIFLMDPAQFPSELAGFPVRALNGSMWTIAYEFRCYLLVALLWSIGLLANKRGMLALAITGICTSVLMTFDSVRNPLDGFAARYHGAGWIIGTPADTLQLTAVFLVGILFYLYRDILIAHVSGRIAALCALAAATLMYRDPHFASVALTTLGAVPLFWLSFKAKLGPLQKINDDWDISYGTYLYGWPVTILVLWLDRGLSPWLLAAIALPVSLICGALSWWGIESWTKDINKSRSTARKGAQQRPLPQSLAE
jgi:peptidoglycan/LPS O-acetylase OafA/YrhL